MALLLTISTLQGVCALTVDSDPFCFLALPSQSEAGSIRVYDALEGGNVRAELSAHKSSVVCYALLVWARN